MLNFIKELFNKDSENSKTAESIFDEQEEHYPIYRCNKCPENNNCDAELLYAAKKNTNRIHNTFSDRCAFETELEGFNKKKDTIFIIDDNEGMVSFLEDDMEYLEEKGVIDKDKMNILSLTGSHSAFTFEVLQKRENGLNIKWAIIDITLGGSIMTREGNIKYTGIDVYDMLQKYNPEAKFLFYTGNNLNPYIKRNKQLIEQFKTITNGKNIMDYVLFKTSMDMDSRREYIAKYLFDTDIKAN